MGDLITVSLTKNEAKALVSDPELRDDLENTLANRARRAVKLALKKEEKQSHG